MIDNLQPEDMPQVWNLADSQAGGPHLPRIFDERDRLMPNVALALKTVHKGRIVQAHVFELVPELLTFGTSARGTVVSLPHLPVAMLQLEKLGFYGFRTLVAEERVEAFERSLREPLNMKRDERLAHYYRPFREGLAK